MAHRIATVEDLAWRGLRLRLWCFGCGRSRTLDASKVLKLAIDKGWPVRLVELRSRFPCRRCRSAADVMIVPASPPAPPAPEPEPPDRELSWADEVARFFHANRRKRRDRPLPPAVAAAIERMANKKGPGDRPGPSKRRIDDLD